MKITPLEIRQKDFEKKLRGYDKDEVNAFLQSLSNEWERVLEENKELSLKFQQAEKEVSKLREVESSLYKTLKTAEDTGANVIEQANKAAELHMKETKMNAEALLSESKNKARAMVEQAEVEARQIIEELQDAVKSIEQNHREIENHRQNALQELKNLSVTLIEKVERNTEGKKEFNFEDYVRRVKDLARISDERIKAENTEVSAEVSQITVEDLDKREEPISEPDTVATKTETKQEDTPPTTQELKERISENRIKKEESQAPPQEEQVQAPKSDQPQESLLSKESEPIEKPKTQERKVEKAEKKGPRISKTVSFFDQLDSE